MYTALDRTRFGNVIRALLVVFALAAMLTAAVPRGAMALEDDSVDAASTLNQGEMPAPDWGTSGNPLSIFPHELQAPDSLLHPAGIAVANDGMVYVVASGNDRIDIYSELGTYLESWGDTGSGPGEFIFHDTDEDWNYGDIAIDEDGNFYVADPGNKRVQVFDAERDFVRAIGDPGYPPPAVAASMMGYQDLLMSPAGLAIDDANDKLYIADANSDTVKSYSLDGRALNEWGTNGVDSQGFDELFDIAVADDGSLWVADFGRSSVLHLSAEGELLSILGSHGVGAGQFMGAAGIAIDNTGAIYVTDFLEGEIHVISNDGTLTGVLTSDFGTPTYVTVDNDGDLWVSYENNNTVVNWTTTAPFSGTWIGAESANNGGGGGK